MLLYGLVSVLAVAAALFQENVHPFLPYNVRVGLIRTTSWDEFITQGYYTNGTTANNQVDALFYFAYNKVKIRPNGKLDEQSERVLFDLDGRLLRINHGAPSWVTVLHNAPVELVACANFSLGRPLSYQLLSEAEVTVVNAFVHEYTDLHQSAARLAYLAGSCADALARCVAYVQATGQVPPHRQPYIELLCQRALASPPACGTVALSVYAAFVCETGYTEACINVACAPGSTPSFPSTSDLSYRCVCDRVYADVTDCSRAVTCTLPGCSGPSAPTIPPPQAFAASLGWETGRWYILAGCVLLGLAGVVVATLRAKTKTKRQPAAVLYVLLPVAHVVSLLGVAAWDTRTRYQDPDVQALVVAVAVGAAWNLVAFTAYHATSEGPAAEGWPGRSYSHASNIASLLLIPAINSLGLLAIDAVALRSSHLANVRAFAEPRSSKAQWWVLVGVLGTFLAQTVAGGVFQVRLAWSTEPAPTPLQLSALVLAAAACVGRLVFLWPLVKYYRRAAFALKGARAYLGPPPNGAAARILAEEQADASWEVGTYSTYDRTTADVPASGLVPDEPFVQTLGNPLWRREADAVGSDELTRSQTCPVQRSMPGWDSVETLVAPGNQLETIEEEEEEPAQARKRALSCGTRSHAITPLDLS